MIDVILFFLYLFLILGSLYGYYRLCKWLTYDFFTEDIEKTGDWIKDYVYVYSKKLIGIILLIPVAIFILVAIIAASGKSSGGFSRSRSSFGSDDEEYVIQYRSGGTWIDGPGSNNERVAEHMFDQFLSNDPRGSKRCRLVHKFNGRVQSVLSTN